MLHVTKILRCIKNRALHGVRPDVRPGLRFLLVGEDLGLIVADGTGYPSPNVGVGVNALVMRINIPLCIRFGGKVTAYRCLRLLRPILCVVGVLAGTCPGSAYRPALGGFIDSVHTGCALRRRCRAGLRLRCGAGCCRC